MKHGRHANIFFNTSRYGDNDLGIRFRNGNLGRETDKKHYYKLFETVLLRRRRMRRRMERNSKESLFNVTC